MRERRLEQRQSAFRIATGAQPPATLEIEAHLCDGARSGKSLCLLKQSIAAVEVVMQTLDSRELGQHLGAPGVFGLVRQLRAESLLGRLQVGEIPESPEAIAHAPHAIDRSHRRLRRTRLQSRILPGAGLRALARAQGF